jgi:hypothetical protein
MARVSTGSQQPREREESTTTDTDDTTATDPDSTDDPAPGSSTDENAEAGTGRTDAVRADTSDGHDRATVTLAKRHIARSGGDGARSATEEWVAQNARPASNDGRSPTRTTFYAHDVDSIGPGQKHRDPEDRRSWGSLAKWQDGVQSDISRGGQNWQADKNRWFDTFASYVEATERQEDRARYIVDAVDIGPFQGAHIPIEWVILGALSIAIDEDAPDLASRAVERTSFAKLHADMEMDRADLRDVRQKLRAQL